MFPPQHEEQRSLSILKPYTAPKVTILTSERAEEKLLTKETVDQLIQFLTAMAHHSREYALKLKALEQVAKKHFEIFLAYEEYLEELRASARSASHRTSSGSGLASKEVTPVLGGAGFPSPFVTPMHAFAPTVHLRCA